MSLLNNVQHRSKEEINKMTHEERCRNMMKDYLKLTPDAQRLVLKLVNNAAYHDRFEIDQDGKPRIRTYIYEPNNEGDVKYD